MTATEQSPTCVACGMPMRSADEFAQGDPTKDYCRYCARPDGAMQSYEEKLDSLTHFMMRTQGFEEAPAGEMARAMMAKLPAWSGRAE